MSVIDIIELTIKIIKGVYKVAGIIYDTKHMHEELRDAVKHALTILKTVEDVLSQWEKLANEVDAQNEEYIRKYIDEMKTSIIAIGDVLDEVHRDRNVIQRLVMRTHEYKQKLLASVGDLTEVHRIVDSTTNQMARIEVKRRELPNFRRLFPNLPDKDISKFHFSFSKNPPTIISKTALRKYDPMSYLCYMRICGEQLLIGCDRSVWLATKPKAFIREERGIVAQRDGQRRSSADCMNDNSTTNALASNAAVVDLDFKEFSMASDHLCGLTSTQSIMYIATKHEITVVQLMTGATIAQYRGEEDGYKAFKQISYIYIPPNDEESLYIVDSGQCTIHQYQIDDMGRCFEYIRQFVIIANVNQNCKLVSCIIQKGNLYVSDNENNCLHVFPLGGERQSCYLTIDPGINPLSTGSLSAYGNYLYVTIYSAESTSILVLDEECNPVDCFRHQSLGEILAIDLDLDSKELFILATKTIDNQETKRPLIVSMDLSLRSN